MHSVHRLILPVPFFLYFVFFSLRCVVWSLFVLLKFDETYQTIQIYQFLACTQHPGKVKRARISNKQQIHKEKAKKKKNYCKMLRHKLIHTPVSYTKDKDKSGFFLLLLLLLDSFLRILCVPKELITIGRHRVPRFWFIVSVFFSIVFTFFFFHQSICQLYIKYRISISSFPRFSFWLKSRVKSYLSEYNGLGIRH